MKLSIILININQEKFTSDCIQSILDNETTIEKEIILVDNGSEKDCLNNLKQKFYQIKFIENHKNLGFSRANNQGIKESTGDYVLILNNDTLELKKDSILQCINALEQEKAGILTCRLENFDGKTQGLEGKEESLNDVNEIIDIPYANGAFMLLKREVIDKIGVFNNVFNPIYYEDIEYSERARKAGFRIIYYPKVTFKHFIGATISKKFNDIKYFITKRNYFLFLMLNKQSLFRDFVIGFIGALKKKKLKLFLMSFYSAFKINRGYVNGLTVDSLERYCFVNKELYYCNSVLDAGGGSGDFWHFLDWRIDYEVLDVSEESIKLAIEKGIKAKQGSITKLPFKDCSFDAVVSIASLEHLSTFERIEFAEEAKRVCKKRVVLFVPLGFSGRFFDYCLYNFRKVLGIKDNWTEEHLQWSFLTETALLEMFPNAVIKKRQNILILFFNMILTNIPYLNKLAWAFNEFLLKHFNDCWPFYGCVLVWKKEELNEVKVF